MIAFPASLLILDGKSADDLPLRNTITKLCNEGVEIHVRMTWEKDNAQHYADEVHQLGVETVIAGGGDGAVNEASMALTQSQGDNIPALDVLPLGTANDFATSVGTPDDLNKALKLAVAANVTEIDMTQVNDKTCFINMTTGGFGTRIAAEAPEKLKTALDGVSYFIRGLMRMDTLKPGICGIRGEDFHWQGKALVIGIGNGCQTDGRRQLCPMALISGGLLQLHIFTDEELLPGLLSALTQSEDSPDIIDDASSWFDIHAPYEITFNLDGEPLNGQEFRIKILPAVLRCKFPSGCPLLH